MFRLTREVRFAVNVAAGGSQASRVPTNGYAGFPSLDGLGHFFTLGVTLAGPLDPRTSYLRNIREIDDVVRDVAVERFTTAVRHGCFGGGGGVLLQLAAALRDRWPGATLDRLRLALSPFLSLEVCPQESPAMVRLSQTFEFAAAHRLHNPALSDADNARAFGKCNNPHGHGHNYQVRVTLAGTPDAGGRIADVPAFERTVAEAAIDRLDHKFLNAEVPEFRDLNPSVENIAMVVYRLLKPALAPAAARLHSVTVWETPKTWAEYSEEELDVKT